MSKSVRLRGFGDQDLDQVMDHIEQEVEDAPT